MRYKSEGPDKTDPRALAITIVVILSVLAALYWPLFAKAQGHDVNDPSHWYPMECCHAMDCAPVTSAAVSTPIEGGGMPNMVVTSKHGTVLVPHNFKRRDSKDGRMHVCMRPSEGGEMRLICIFDPPGM